MTHGKVGGIAGIQKKMQVTSQQNQATISGAFQDLESLKSKAKDLVKVAETIQNKIKRKELDSNSEEMKEIQSVMFNMGLAGNLSVGVSKDLAGKHYFSELAKEIEKFCGQVLERFGGVLALVDLYCLYNRARGTDLISPEDLMIACEKLN